MKNLFYYLFGLTSALYAFMMLFNAYACELLDDYWLDYISTNYAKVWYYGSFAIGILFALFAIIFIYNLGKGTNHKKKEPLLINKKEKEDE